MSGTAVGKRDVPLLLPPAFRVKVIPGMFRIMASCCRATRSCSARSELARIRILEGQAGCEMGMSDRPGYPGPSGPVEWLPHRPSAVLGWQGGGEEVDEQLVDTFSLVVMHPMRRLGQALDAVEVGHVSAVGLGELWAEVAIALPPDDQGGR
jgi:hypothetical protein